MKTLLLLALLPSLALADVPGDTPLADLPGTSVRLEMGQAAPFPGRLLSDAEQVRRGKVDARNAAELASLKSPENVTLTKPALIVLVSGSAVLAAVVTGLVVGFATQPKK